MHHREAVRLECRETRFPSVRYMGRVDVAHAPTAEIKHLAVREHARRAVGEIVERHQACRAAMDYLRFWRRLEPQIHRTAFVGFDMAERDPAQPLDGRTLANAARMSGNMCRGPQ